MGKEKKPFFHTKVGKGLLGLVSVVAPGIGAPIANVLSAPDLNSTGKAEKSTLVGQIAGILLIAAGIAVYFFGDDKESGKELIETGTRIID